MIVQPTFIYGGETFGINPPRVATGYGRVVEGILSAGPFQALASVAPGLIGVALDPPVNVDTVAAACVAGALGDGVLTPDHNLSVELDTYEKIQSAADALGLTKDRGK